nr:hypothetical protein [uncultured Pseudomonas sp.]
MRRLSDKTGDSEQQRLPSPILTVGAVIFCWMNDELLVLVEKRSQEPFRNVLALPSRDLGPDFDHDLMRSRDRALFKTLGFLPNYMEQLQTMGSCDRDPRGWSVSIFYLCILGQDHPILRKMPSHLSLLPISMIFGSNGAQLAFDHLDVLNLAYQRLQDKIIYTTLPLFFLPDVFSITMLMSLHFTILGHETHRKIIHERYLETGVIRKEPGVKQKFGCFIAAHAYRSTVVVPVIFEQSLKPAPVRACR